MHNRIREYREVAGLSQQRLADLCKPPTSRQQIDRLEKKDPGELKTRQIAPLAKALDTRPEVLLGLEPDRALREPEARFIDEPDLGELELELARLLYPDGPADTMVVAGQSMLLLGYAPGDRILVDLNRAPTDGDVVVVQIYDDTAGGAETILRRYKPPLLLPASPQLGFDAHSVDDAHVAIKAVVVARYQLSHSS